MRADLFINVFVVIVQPLTLVLTHFFRIDAVQVDRSEGDRFKIHELSVLVLHAFSYDKFVFNTDTELAVLVDAWFVCDDHAFLQLVMLQSDTKWTLPLAIANLQGEMSSDFGLIMAGAALAAIPIVVVFIAFQKYLTQ